MFGINFSFDDIPTPNVRLIYLLFAVLFLLVSYPFFINGPLYFIPVVLLDVIIPLLAVYVAADHTINLFLASVLAIPLAILSWLSLVDPSSLVLSLLYIFGIIFYGFSVYVVLHQIIKRNVITEDIIVGSIAAYLMVGLTWTNIYALIHHITGNGFETTTNLLGSTGTQIDYIYYSFVTLTNVGYGGMLAANHYTRAFSILESAAGVIFTAVVVGRVVGLYVSEQGHSVFKEMMDN
ncbi:MAG: ion channel [Candidatus Magasanikbacteria bacterium]